MLALDIKYPDDFNPRSREGSDTKACIELARKRNFNPRSREGSDSFGRLSVYHPLNFNPRSREGSDRGRLRTSAPFEIFQSTLPRRERLR